MCGVILWCPVLSPSHEVCEVSGPLHAVIIWEVCNCIEEYYHRQYWYLPAPPVETMPTVDLKLGSVSDSRPGRQNFTFHMRSKQPIAICWTVATATLYPNHSPPSCLNIHLPPPGPYSHQLVTGDVCAPLLTM